MIETLSIKVPSAQKARLKALANKRKTTLTSLMREALDRLSRESEAVAPASCFQLTHDLFDTPGKLGASDQGDRSVNKQRLKSFGRSRK